MDLLAEIETLEVLGDPGVSIRGLSSDSRSIQPGDLFVALPGAKTDGHHFIEDAAQRGAVALLVERFPAAEGKWNRCVCVRVSDALRAMGQAAAALYEFPGRRMTFVGITGSNGKTTTAYLVEQIFRRWGHRTGAITTVTDWWPGRKFPARFTTPRSDELQRLLWQMRRDGVTHVVSEVSSHALVQHRMTGIAAEAAVFTNLSFEHRELHPTQEDYFQAKRRLFFDYLRPAGLACVNLDDPMGERLARELSHATLVTYGFSPKAAVRAEMPNYVAGGTAFLLLLGGKRFPVRTRLLGRFNVLNILAAASTAWGLGIPAEFIANMVEDLGGPPGRLERIDEGQDFSVFVDYGHTPDALEQVLTSLREVARGRIITLMGCGGNRSPEKRAPMGRIAAEKSDFVVVTSDNSRWEKTSDIIRQIEEGMTDYASRYMVEEDRSKAIVEAIRRAETDDIVLLAGKGHETGQTEQGETRPFDDRDESRRALRSLIGERAQRT